MKLFYLAILGLIPLLGKLDRLYFKANDSFNPKYMTPNWSYCPPMGNIRVDQITQLLDQPFSYLGKGEQMFIFKSADEQWVLKFFRLPKTIRFGSYYAPPCKTDSLKRVMASYQFAQTNLPSETRVLYSHLSKTKNLSINLELYDRLGRHHRFNADRVPFVLQRAGTDFFDEFRKLEFQEAREVVYKTIKLFSRMHEGGFIDRDPILDQNFGLCDGSPFLLDAGQIVKCESLPPKAEYLMAMTHSLAGFLEREFPELKNYYDQLILSE